MMPISHLQIPLNQVGIRYRDGRADDEGALLAEADGASGLQGLTFKKRLSRVWFDSCLESAFSQF